MTIEIEEAASPKELNEFVRFQFSLYKENPYWVPPIRSDEIHSLRRDVNPAFEFCDAAYWIARRDGRIVGRIAAIVNKRYNEKWHAKAARFGWVDFIDDPDVSSALFSTAERWATDRGLEWVHGPLGFTDMDAEGTLIEGFEEQSTFGSIYNFPYYPAHIEACGYTKDTDWVEYQITMHPDIPEKVSRLAEIALSRNHLSVLRVKKAKNLLPYAKEVFHVLNSAYKDLYGFVELSEAQIDLYVKQYFGFIKPEFVPVVLDADGRVAAFGIAMPTLSTAFQKCNGRLFPFGFIHVLKALRKTNAIDLYLTAVRPDLQNKGVNAILMHEMNKAFIRNGVRTAETNRELEENAKVQAQWRHYEHRLHKRRRCYRKDLTKVADAGH